MLRGRVALVTGGSSGIGLAVARAFVTEGMKVVVAARGRERLERAASELGKGALAVPCDVADPEQVTDLVARAVDRFGSLNVLVNNAGMAAWGDVAEFPPERWRRVLDVNVTGAFLCARAAWPHLAAGEGGYVFNVSSIAGKEGFGGASAYSASKFALMGLSESLREEGAPLGIKVSAICPGYVDTPMVAGAAVPPDEMIRPEDIAATCLYLLRLSPNACVPEVVIRRMGA